MYRYEYETVSCELGGWGFGGGNIYSTEDYRSVINKRKSICKTVRKTGIWRWLQ